jgi:hypothetical protein
MLICHLTCSSIMRSVCIFKKHITNATLKGRGFCAPLDWLFGLFRPLFVLRNSGSDSISDITAHPLKSAAHGFNKRIITAVVHMLVDFRLPFQQKTFVVGI